MKSLIINPKSRTLLYSYLKDPTHALLLTGQSGVGLGTIAKTLAKTIAGPDAVVIAPSVHPPQKTANINVDDIKTLLRISRNKRKTPLVIVIDEAEQMTNRAPEAFLKLLEEPNPNIHFILTSHSLGNLPKTVLSRVQKIEILPCVAETDSLLQTIRNKPEKKLTQIAFLGRGLPAEIKRLSENDDYFQGRSRSFAIAKEFLGANTYNRLKIVANLKERPEAIAFVRSLANLSQILAEKAPNPAKLAILSDILDGLAQNGGLKAQLTHLAVNF
ncbi:MAG: AAA family ATPase [Candidatus Nomurabacteria bacterium]|jgi:hypothetical protein|nr:AAA family ATPase [Candidatus Nomurabacteria bacterium]